ncbi:bacterial SH3 domain protein [Tritonibacter horizontis]|uniref:Bacterial SH3 domain protein n=1 Tax=Tritonibacter horizontis TaxID=1768241 RepID=A0A132BXQ7_9RHOB|nr:bacterial SH3 domain protein [Tritonibacter horizontis]
MARIGKQAVQNSSVPSGRSRSALAAVSRSLLVIAILLTSGAGAMAQDAQDPANAEQPTTGSLEGGEVATAAPPETAAEAAEQTQKRGPVTTLPLPRFVSMKASVGNVRRGPSLTHRIDWVFKRRGMPLEITAEYQHWRRVRDRDGAGGWVHYALLSGTRTVMVEEDMLRVRARPEESAPVMAAFELGVVAQLGACIADWCEISAGGHSGWALKEKLWGVAPDELRD